MRKKSIILFSVMAAAIMILSGCKKKEEGSVEENLQAVSLDQLEEGNFYVRSGDSYYKIPIEECNFDLTKDAKTNDDKQAGIMPTGVEDGRVLDYVYKDNAIPTLYQNDTLVYVTDSEISSFTWERFLDLGYSIGVYGMSLNNGGKVTTDDKSNYSPSSSITEALQKNEISSLGGITFDKINNTPITKDYLNENVGIITGMSKDANANVDAFIGTTHIPMNIKADTRYFQSFELYNSTEYNLSTDGYAVVEVPSYLKSGYYLLNNKGLVKYLSIDRGNDEASLDLTIPYYYKDADGNTLTYYEWREQNGYTDEGIKQDVKQTNDKIDVTEYPERMKFTTDSSAVGLNVSINYTYKSSTAMQNASKTGEFPRAVLIDPHGTVTSFENNKDNTENEDGSYTMKLSLDSAPCGDWYVLFRNFDNAYKDVETELVSGNATTYIHNGMTGNISIYYETAATPQTIHVTWEQSDRTATDVTVRTPDEAQYTMKDNPDLFHSFAGGVDITLPNMAEGTYKIDLTGDTLGRVWFTRENAPMPVVEETTTAEETQPGETTSIDESASAAETAAAEKKPESETTATSDNSGVDAAQAG